MNYQVVKSRYLALGFFAAVATTPLLGNLPASAKSMSQTTSDQQTTATASNHKQTSSLTKAAASDRAGRTLSERKQASTSSTTHQTTKAAASDRAGRTLSERKQASSPSTTPRQSNDLKIGSQGKLVSQVQSALKKQKLYNGPVNGNFGRETRSAVMAFQRSKNLKADGVVGSKTLAAMGIQ